MAIYKKNNAFSDFQRHSVSPKYCSIFKIPWLESLYVVSPNAGLEEDKQLT